MRIYLSATLPLLARAAASGRYGEPGAFAHAVTPALREWYTTGDAEELEYAAMLEAAQASLRLLAADASAPRRRVVVAAEVDAALVASAPGEPARSTVALAGPVTAEHVVSVHVDDDAAAGDVDAAARALPAAARGESGAQFAVDTADAHDLLWYDAREIPALVDPPPPTPPQPGHLPASP